MIRLRNHHGTYVLRQPVKVIDSELFGECFRATFQVEGYAGWERPGTFPLCYATLIEPVSDQLELRDAA